MKEAVSAAFRRHLKQQLPVLRQEGLITTDQELAISDRYSLDRLAYESTHKLIAVIYTVGAFLIGIGVISFVAAHWTAIPRTFKVSLISAAMLAAHLAGYYLWKVSRKSPSLGHALIILGILIFGANIGLMAQIFHVEGRWNGAFLPWSVGAIVMAWAVQSTPVAVIAIVTSFIWFLGGIGWNHQAGWSYYPFAAAAAFLPYCFWRRSAFAFTLSLFAIAVAAVLSSTGRGQTGLLLGVSSAAVGLLYSCWGLIAAGGERFKSFAAPAIFLGFLAMTIAVYMASFQKVAGEWLYSRVEFDNVSLPAAVTPLVALVVGIVLVVPAAFRSRTNPAAAKILAAAVLSFILFLVGSLTFSQFAFALLANVALFALGAAFIWTARDLEDRRLFWSGVILIALMIVSRTLEYETGLLVKAVVFTAGGVAIIALGIMYEKFLTTRRIAHE